MNDTELRFLKTFWLSVLIFQYSFLSLLDPWFVTSIYIHALTISSQLSWRLINIHVFISVYCFPSETQIRKKYTWYVILHWYNSNFQRVGGQTRSGPNLTRTTVGVRDRYSFWLSTTTVKILRQNHTDFRLLLKTRKKNTIARNLATTTN